MKKASTHWQKWRLSCSSFFSSAATALLLAGCCRLPPPPTVEELDLARFMGTWYEIEALPKWFQKGCQGTEAHYEQTGDATFTITNRCWKGEDGCTLSEAKARGWQPSTEFPGRLKVRFYWPFTADYWIFQLDPSYQWALVGSPDRSGLWILSRERFLDEVTLERLKAWSREQGFPINQLKKTSQRAVMNQKDCP
jgi:apolipoprotein D and lipocalin family protein